MEYKIRKPLTREEKMILEEEGIIGIERENHLTEEEKNMIKEMGISQEDIEIVYDENERFDNALLLGIPWLDLDQ